MRVSPEDREGRSGLRSLSDSIKRPEVASTLAPREVVAGLYERWPQPRTFAEDVAGYRATGYVVETAEFFLMGRAVDRFAAAEEIADPWRAFRREEQNAWLVFAFAGSSRYFFSFVPYWLPWVGFQRRGRALRFYALKEMARLGGKLGIAGFAG